MGRMDWVPCCTFHDVNSVHFKSLLDSDILVFLPHRHLHLHVLSADLVSERMKNKKHYNSFHPSLGFFLHIDDVLSWFEAEPSYFSRVCRFGIVDEVDSFLGPLELDGTTGCQVTRSFAQRRLGMLEMQKDHEEHPNPQTAFARGIRQSCN